MVACGGGCPLALVPHSVLGTLNGACVVDLGCGGGHDLALASHLVGPAGRTVGIDLTPQMVGRAASVVAGFGLGGPRHGQLICAPIDCQGSGSRPESENGKADLVISNGVVNLCLDKQGAFDTAAFWCKPGGLFAYSDVVVSAGPSAGSCNLGRLEQ